MWQVLTYTSVEVKLRPYNSAYVLAIVENDSGERLIAQLDAGCADKITIGSRGNIKTTIGPAGEINSFVLSGTEDESCSPDRGQAIKKVGIIGSGVVGLQLAQFVAMQGFATILKSRERTQLNSAAGKIEKRLMKYMSVSEKDKIIRNIVFTTDYGMLSDADIVIDCIVEDEAKKQHLFKQLESVCQERTIFATNTSSLSVDALGSVLKNPERFVCMHFFNPIEKMRLVEVITGSRTAAETGRRIIQFAKQLNKVPIVMKDSPGGIVNRLMFLMINEAAYMLAEGILPEDIDKAMEMGANYPMGPCRLADFVGIDISYEIIINLSKVYDHFRPPAPIFADLIKEGRLGRKTGRGFFEYNR